MEEVLAVIERNHDWKLWNVNEMHGYYAGANEERVGEKSISIILGEYSRIYTISVSADWGFDADGNLIDIHVWKEGDLP